MKAKGSGNDFSINCGETTTGPETIGTGGTQSHGNFSGLGQGITWDDESYTGKYASTELKFSLRKQDGTEITIPSGKETLTVRSNVPSYNVKL